LVKIDLDMAESAAMRSSGTWAARLAAVLSIGCGTVVPGETPEHDAGPSIDGGAPIADGGTPVGDGSVVVHGAVLNMGGVSSGPYRLVAQSISLSPAVVCAGSICLKGGGIAP
jgi:hypothetical protein